MVRQRLDQGVGVGDGSGRQGKHLGFQKRSDGGVRGVASISIVAIACGYLHAMKSRGRKGKGSK